MTWLSISSTHPPHHQPVNRPTDRPQGWRLQNAVEATKRFHLSIGNDWNYCVHSEGDRGRRKRSRTMGFGMWHEDMISSGMEWFVCRGASHLSLNRMNEKQAVWFDSSWGRILKDAPRPKSMVWLTLHNIVRGGLASQRMLPSKS